MKSALFLLSILCSITCLAGEKEYLLEGTIDKYPIVLQLSAPGAGPSATYYYRSSKRSIELDGKVNNGIYTLYGVKWNEKKSTDDTVEVFEIHKDEGDKWSGTWTDKKKRVYTVTLSPLNINSIRHPYPQLKFVQEALKSYPLAYVRSSEISLVNDSIIQKGKYKLQYCHINKTGIASFTITTGLTAAVQHKVNDVLLNAMFSDAESYFSCTSHFGEGDFSYDLAGTYISDNIISTRASIGYYCGGAHPDEGIEAININALTGQELTLDDVLHFPGCPPGTQSDNWYNYRDSIFAPKVMAILTGLYPQQMKGNENCDYSDTEVWNFPSFYFTPKGIQILPNFPHVVLECGYADWAIIPYNILSKYADPKLKLHFP